jgi:hypothetical protein
MPLIENDHRQPAPRDRPADPGTRIIERDDSARQGPLGRPVLMVLVAALLLAGIYLTGMLIWVGLRSPDHPTQDASREVTTGAPSGSSRNPSDRTAPANPAYPSPAAPAGANPAGPPANR